MLHRKEVPSLGKGVGEEEWEEGGGELKEEEGGVGGGAH